MVAKRNAVTVCDTALRFATIVPGAYCCHHADSNSLSSA
ncbi:hypothetical protein PSZ98_24245 [Shigella sonnei]|nr:hypothetical protein [Shigella sonnei]